MNKEKEKESILLNFLKDRALLKVNEIKEVSKFCDTVCYKTFYNPMNTESDSFNVTYNTEGNIQNTYSVDDNLSAIIRSIHIYRPHATIKTEGRWEYLDNYIYPIDINKIPLLDKDFGDTIKSDLRKGKLTHVSYERKDSVCGWIDYWYWYRVSNCRKYIVRYSYYTNHRQEDPASEYQQIEDCGWEEPQVYKFAD